MSLLAAVQRVSSRIPGGVAVKRTLRDSATACGTTYWLSTAQRGPSFTLLMYHMVLEQVDPYYGYGIHLPVFDAQLRMFRRFCAVLSLDEIVHRLEEGQPLPRRCLALTFDDGYRDMITRVEPLLRRYRLPATLYVATDAVEKGFLWPDLLRYTIRHARHRTVTLTLLPEGPSSFSLRTETEKLRAVRYLDPRLKRLPDARKWEVLEELCRMLLGCSSSQVHMPGLMLSWGEVHALSHAGVTIGAHTITHPILTQQSDEQAEREVVISRRVLQEQLGESVHHFAYPNGNQGDYSPRIQAAVQEAGFRSACTTVPGLNSPGEDRWTLKRVDGVQRSMRALVRAMALED